MPSDTDREAVNKRIAEATRLRAIRIADPLIVRLEEGQTVDVPFPDFFTDSEAADRLMQWLDENGYRWNMLNYFERKGCPRQTTVQVWRKEWAIGRARGPERHPDWKVAFAEAADAAIKEAARGEAKGLDNAK